MSWVLPEYYGLFSNHKKKKKSEENLNRSHCIAIITEEYKKRRKKKKSFCKDLTKMLSLLFLQKDNLKQKIKKKNASHTHSHITPLPT